MWRLAIKGLRWIVIELSNDEKILHFKDCFVEIFRLLFFNFVLKTEYGIKI